MFRMDRIRCAHPLVLTCLAWLLCQSAAFGQWSQNKSLNNEVSVMPFISGQPQTLTDGAGGTYVVWATQWGTTNNDVYLNFIDANGIESTEISVGSGSDPVIAGNGNDFYVAWSDLSKRLRLQRFVHLSPQWAQPFTFVTTGSAIQTQPTLITDGVGGAIVAWTQQSPGSSSTDIHAMRFNSAGARDSAWLPWSTGFVVNAFPGNQRRPDLASDSASSAFVVWEHVNPSTLDTDIYARYVNLGTLGVAPGWPTAQPVVGAAGHQVRPKAVSDEDFGILVGWNDARNGLSELYAQRVWANGVHFWTPNGVRVGSGLAAEPFFDIDHDGSQGAVLAWSSGYEIRFQQLEHSPSLPSGVNLVWGTNGMALTSGSTFTNQQRNPSLVSDGQGGAMVAWGTHSKINSNVGDIYAQYVDSSGSFRWVSGVNLHPVVSDAANRQDFPSILQHEIPVSGVMCFDRGARVFWRDDRPGAEGLYAQRVKCDGALGIVDPGGGGGIGLEVGSAQIWGEFVRLPVGVTFAHGVQELDELSLTFSFDPEVLGVQDVMAGTAGEVAFDLDAASGVLVVELAGGAVEEGQPLLELVLTPRGIEGSSAVAIHGGGGNGISIWPRVGVVTVGDSH